MTTISDIKPVVWITGQSINEREQDWLWFPYLPLGACAMLFGPGGMGKSHITCDLAARLSTGKPFPGQETALSPHNVLMLSAEDDYETVLAGRLRRAGADLNRIYLPSKSFVVEGSKIKQIEQKITETEAKLCIIDPVVSWLGGKRDINRANDTREFTGGLHEMAQRTGCTLLIVHHSRKGGEGDDFEKAMGSIDFINATRSVLYVNKTNDGTRAMRHVKTNYGREGNPIAYELTDSGLDWLAEITVDQLLKPVRGASKKMETAKSFLRNVLKDGPIEAKELILMASDNGISKATLDRAKVGVAESFYKKDVGYMWQLVAERIGKALEINTDGE